MFHQFNTIKSNIILLTSFIVIFSITNSYSIIVLQYKPEQNSQINETIYNNNTYQNGTFFHHQSRCTIRHEYADDRLTLLINMLVAGVLNLALPSILILILNITMLCYIKHIYSRRSSVTIKGRSDTSNYRSTRSTLLVISMTYTLFYVPYVVFYFLIIILDDKDGTFYNWSEVSYILRHVSHSVNFYAYIFTNIRFRREISFLFRYLFRSCCSLEKRHQYKQKKKKLQPIVLNKCRLSPQPLMNSLTPGKYQLTTFVHVPNQIDSIPQTPILVDGKHGIQV